jgi:hypothetical protein
MVLPPTDACFVEENKNRRGDLALDEVREVFGWLSDYLKQATVDLEVSKQLQRTMKQNRVYLSQRDAITFRFTRQDALE